MQARWWELEQHDSNSVYVSRSLDRAYAFSLAIVAGRAADERRANDNPGLHQSLYETYKDIIGWSIGREYTSIANTPETQRVCLGKSTEVEALTYIRNQIRALHNRRFFMTSKGYHGVGHNPLELGDVCAVLRGANIPFILRKASTSEQNATMSNHYRLVSESYIRGVMNGEAFKM